MHAFQHNRGLVMVQRDEPAAETLRKLYDRAWCIGRGAKTALAHFVEMYEGDREEPLALCGASTTFWLKAGSDHFAPCPACIRLAMKLDGVTDG